MTLAEFNAWLEGYSEAIGEAPNAEQWKRIQAKLATVGPVDWGTGSATFKAKHPSGPVPVDPNILVGGAGGYVPTIPTAAARPYWRDWETIAVINN